MVIYNAATRELTAKIVYYGPGLCGKTTNLKVLHDRLEPGTAGKLLNLQTQTDRTIYFDLLPVELGDIKGYKIRFQLATVPGQTAFNETRRVVLKGVDGIVFVADSQWTMLPKNLESWQNLKDNLKSNEISFEKIPVVVQYNKRDLADILAVDAMQEALGLSSYPFVEAVASAGRGVTETFKLISKLTFVDLLRRLQGRRAEEEAAAAAAAEEARQDDLQTWKDSLLKRESQANVAGPRAPSRPFSLVPRVSDEAPVRHDGARPRGRRRTTSASPYAVPEPPGLEPGRPMELTPPAATIEMDAIGAGRARALGRGARGAHRGRRGRGPDRGESVERSRPSSPGRGAGSEPRPRSCRPRRGPAPRRAPRAARAAPAGVREPRRAGARGRRAPRPGRLAALQERVTATPEHLAALGDRVSRPSRRASAASTRPSARCAQRLAPVESRRKRRGGLEASLQGLEAALRRVSTSASAPGAAASARTPTTSAWRSAR